MMGPTQPAPWRRTGQQLPSLAAPFGPPVTTHWCEGRSRGLVQGARQMLRSAATVPREGSPQPCLRRCG